VNVYRQLPANVPFRPEPWMQQAACQNAVDPDLWFVSHNQGAAAVAQAKRICRACPVTATCLAYALTYPVPLYGIWGSTTEVERDRLRRRNTVKT
jgi:WhiB family redox-sensing transcriptional regulator